MEPRRRSGRRGRSRTITGDRVKEQFGRGAGLADEMIEAQSRRRNAVSDRPGVLIAEGDSWFDYPGSDIVKQLEQQHGWAWSRLRTTATTSKAWRTTRHSSNR